MYFLSEKLYLEVKNGVSVILIKIHNDKVRMISNKYVNKALIINFM